MVIDYYFVSYKYIYTVRFTYNEKESYWLLIFFFNDTATTEIYTHTQMFEAYLIRGGADKSLAQTIFPMS
jgi:hypothetical protein